MTYASVQDVATRLGRPISDEAERAQVEAWLGDIENIIVGRIPDLADRIQAGKPTADVVKMLEANAVVRVVRNPDGKIQERIDDYSYGLAQSTRAGLYLTDDEWALLSPGGSDGAWTIHPASSEYLRRGQWLHPDVWVPLP